MSFFPRFLRAAATCVCVGVCLCLYVSAFMQPSSIHVNGCVRMHACLYTLACVDVRLSPHMLYLCTVCLLAL